MLCQGAVLGQVTVGTFSVPSVVPKIRFVMSCMTGSDGQLMISARTLLGDNLWSASLAQRELLQLSWTKGHLDATQHCQRFGLENWWMWATNLEQHIQDG